VLHRSPFWIATAALVVGVTLSACGSSSASPSPATSVATPVVTIAVATAAAPPTVAPVSTLVAAAAGDKCPTAVTVGAALGITLPKPTTIANGGGLPVPAGATGVACEYAGKTYNVIIELMTNVPPTTIALFSAHFPVPYANVSGVGDQARSFLQTLSSGKDNEGVVATKGTNLVSIVATATPASLAQLEALVSQLL
jgi:hypothetical protein